MLLQGKTALITGSGRGIGREIALKMAMEGANIILADIDSDSMDEAGALLKTMGAAYYAVKMDIGNIEQTGQAVVAAHKAFGTIDILVNNAAIFREASFLTMTPQQWSQNIDINLTGVFNVTRAVAPVMCEQKEGRIVSISSVDAFQGCRNYSHYAMAKAGIVGLTRTLAQELGPCSVRVNAVAPGITLTDMTRERIAANEADYLQKIPLGRVGRPADIANAVLFLASDLSAYITGQVIHVNGGMYFG